MRSCDQQHVSRLGKREDGCVLFVLSASCGKVTVIYGIIEQSWLIIFTFVEREPSNKRELL